MHEVTLARRSSKTCDSLSFMQIVLIRHAHSKANERGVLSGRLPGVALSDKGVEQSQRLVSRLGAMTIRSLHVSPLARCNETISPWWNEVGSKNNPKVALVEDNDIIEVDYGSWSGKKLAVLSHKREWKIVQSSPSAMYFPQGEGLAQVQVRAMNAIHKALTNKGKGSDVFVTHGDVIKTIVSSVLAMHLDDFQRIVIDPASVTVLDYSSDKPRVLLMNDSRSDLESFLNAPFRARNLLGGGA